VLMAVSLRAAIDASAGRIVGGTDPAACARELIEIFHRATRAEQS
jgi:hypothetical protein